MQAESLADQRPDIPSIFQFGEEREEIQKLLIVIVVKPTLDRNAIIQLEAKGLNRVVDNGDLLHIASEDVQILEVVAINTDARVAEHAMFDEFLVGVEDIEEAVSVNTLGGREDDDLEPLADGLEERLQVRPRPHEDLVINAVKVDRKRHLGLIDRLHAAVDKGLVEVQRQRDVVMANFSRNRALSVLNGL